VETVQKNGDFLVGDRTTASRAKSFVPSVSADVAVNALSQINLENFIREIWVISSKMQQQSMKIRYYNSKPMGIDPATR
jgi:hypothetical protein